MIENFVYHVPEKIYFGRKSIENLAKEIGSYRRILIVTGGGSIRKNGIYDEVLKEVGKSGAEWYELAGIKPNPTLHAVYEGIKKGKEKEIELIIAVGGGSVIDSAKMISAGILCEKDVWELIRTKEKVKRAIPLLAVPTIAATGSEMNDGLVLTKEETKEKWGYSSPVLLPKVAFLDPTYTYTVSSYQTACGAVDMLSHVMEVYFNQSPGFPFMDEMMEGLMRTVIKSAPEVLSNPNDYNARANLLWASEWAINGLIDSGASILWSCHGIEHELSAFYDIPHGHGLAIVTPTWMEYVLSEKTAPRMAQWATKVMHVSVQKDSMETAKIGIEKLRTFFSEVLHLPLSLRDVNIDEENFHVMARKVCAWKGMHGVIHGFISLDEHDVYRIYKNCL